MDAQKYQEAARVCDLMADRTRDSHINALAGWLHKALEREHKPTMALVSFNMNHAERFAMLKEYAGLTVPKELAERVAGEPACLIFDYAAKPVVREEGAGGITVCGLPCNALKNCRIAVCDEIKGKDKWVALSDEIDIACLLVNATMAMNQIERTWLKECGQPLFGVNEPVLAMVGMQLLNSDEDRQAVTEVVNAALRRLQMSTKVFDQPREALAWMENFLGEGNLKENHDNRVAKNALLAVQERAKTLMSEAVADGGAIDAAVTQLEKQRGSLEMAGQLAAESILCNELSRLKVMATESIRDFGRRMAADIRSHVETYPLDQLETVDEYVNRSAGEAWDGFLRSMTATTDAELAKITDRLRAQMEMDAGAMLASLAESARRALYSAVYFSQAGADGGAPIAVRSPAEYAGVNVPEMTGQLRRETRNMMLLSIPILLVNPLLAIGNIFVSKAIGKFRTDSELKSARAEMAAQVEMMCAENAENVVRRMSESFDRQMQEGTRNITAAYSGLVNQLEGELRRMKDEQTQKAAAWDVLAEQVQTKIPALLGQL